MRPELLDLNLLRILRAVYATRNVTQAAQQLCITQSAVSNALRRLREHLDDPLFVRSAHGMAPTPLTQALMAPIEHSLQRIETALRDTQSFDPLESTRSFRLLGNDLAQQVFIPTLLRHLAVHAPHVRLETVDVPPEQASQAMAEGRIDLAIGHWPELSRECRRETLFTETFVVLMRRTNPLAGQRLTTAGYLASKHVDYRPGGSSYPALMQALGQIAGPAGAGRHIVFTARHALGLAGVVADSDLLLTIPSRLADSMLALYDTLVTRKPPFSVPRFPISIQWHFRTSHDQASHWLRRQFTSLFVRA
ncbi:LysR family transcriptional regulator [Castellaniella defragrans]|uniref:DNA-binding transcriptional LysR family regulator n=1 Tax=Castellaniella defragrans TaxID=75697 RepID=A0A7W9TR83_CASDE|nr:LysR family transcriptional regulator [Castellaniella defragrans]KAB0620578.1 LysR family transcriptional regulator [Castellaniella defragrans]MBB6085403.1 DNA-binding transcriptional LysR family regulator [Castellaniella defragrans]